MKRQILFFIIVIAITWFYSCKKDDPVSPPPPGGGGLTAGPSSISVQVGQQDSTTISGGRQPYSIQTPPSSTIATAAISGATLTVSSVGVGNTSVTVRDSAGTATVAIPITVTSIAEVEPNDTTTQALGTLGTSDLIVNGSAASASDIDLYSIVLDTGGNLYAAISWSGGSDLDLGVMNTNRVMINFQDTGANLERCTLPSLSAGTYIIQVTSKTTTATSYTLTIGKR